MVTAEEYLRHARTLTTSWPLVADQYITTKPLHDPDDWLPRLRDAHLAQLAQTEGHVFASLAREAWCRATRAQAKARRLAEWYETDSAMLVLGEARLGVAMVDGLLTRTYFRNSADAVKQGGRRHGPHPRAGRAAGRARRPSWPGAAARSTARSRTCSALPTQRRDRLDRRPPPPIRRPMR